MGVPKFFRYISERYPCLSELVKEYQIPEFDNLYLDMNGIIHMCSHPNDFDPHFRITEERIFQDIFHYLEVLFQLIRPRKLFFMAIDGVAPRAKMNQQRGRRFRSAKEAEVLEKKATAKGEKLPSEARFDSNCITPGTVFMAKLHSQLKYFVTSKISTDPNWKGVKVILSGHETPGEGEHKIMEYIRWMKTQPEYDPNTRHCLYGLDADLIMLGLCTHEPHFSLLREEVKFGKQSQRISSPEETKFYLLHLSLMREYLDLEFQALKSTLKFPYDLESIIDDWVLMGFLVGNDFIPHLPDVHIASGALPMLYNAYMEVLPTLDGYINEHGNLKLDRFQKFMEKLSAFDINQFKETYADMKYFESKTGRKMGSKGDHDHKTDSKKAAEVQEHATKNAELDALIKATDDMVLEKFFSDEEDADVNDDEHEDMNVFSSRVYNDDSDSDISDTFRWEFHQHKKDYYRNKLEYGKVTEQVLRDQAEGYVRAIQWNLHYYYHGVASWSWYYPHHYAPYVSDICNFKDVSLNFELGTPFKPFEQLLGVLPSASKSLLPAPYHELMTKDSSPIVEYYPLDFQTDLNGKKQDWEAVVLIPFIDEQRLLSAMNPCEEKLSDDEKKRNSFGPMLEYCYSNESLGDYVAPEYFPTIKNNHAYVREIWREELRVNLQDIVHGLPSGVRLDVYFPGFPTFKHLPFSGELRKAKVQVFDQASRGENMILTLLNVSSVSSFSLKDAVDKYLGKEVYCGWPHLSEGKVIGVADGTKRYNLLSSGKVALENLSTILAAQCEATKTAVANEYMRRRGIDIGEVNLILYVNHVAGRKYVFGQSGRITLEKIYCEIDSPYALQTVVDDIAVHDASFVQFKTLEEVFPVGSKCFLLARPVYGSMAEIVETKRNPEGRLVIKISTNGEPDVDFVRQNQNSIKPQYMPGSKAAQHVGVSSHILSRITGTVFLVVGNKQAENPSKINIGLNLKFNKKNEEVPGFTRKENNQWLYSRKAIALIKEYAEKFPEVFELLTKQTSDDVYDDKDVFPDENCVEKVKELSKWLKEIPSSSVDRQPCGAEILDDEVVAHIDKVVQEFLSNPPESKRLTLQVKPHVVFKDILRVGNLAPDPSTTYQLFDRVVNVRSDTTVPLGLKGTVIGIRRGEDPADTLYDVVFDQEFLSAMSLGGLKGKCYRVSRTYLINISHGVRQGLVLESYRGSKKSSVQINSAFAKWTTSDKAGSSQEVNSKSSHSGKGHNLSHKKHLGPQNKTNNFKFPAPPNVQILPKNYPAQVQSRSSLWNQLQMGSDKRANITDHQAPPSPSLLPKPNENMTKMIDTKTNALKMMLGVHPVSTKENNLNVAGAPSNAKQMNTQACEINQCTKDVCGHLLQIFQKKGIGFPVYSVATLGPDAFAQVKLPDGTVVAGKSATTKQGAAENAAMEALHLLGLCGTCGKNFNTQSNNGFQQNSSRLTGEPQQFFEQFRQHQFPPPRQPMPPPGNAAWSLPNKRQALVRPSFPPGPPPFSQTMPHTSTIIPHHAQPPQNHRFNHSSEHMLYNQHQMRQQKQQFQGSNNHQLQRSDFNEKSRLVPQKQTKQETGKAASFVPLQALKKQRNASKPSSQGRHGSAEKSASKASGVILTQDLQKKEAKIEEGCRGASAEEVSKQTSADEMKTSLNPKNVNCDSVDKEGESTSSRSVSRMKKSRLAINFQSSQQT